MHHLVPHFILEKFAAGERHGCLPAATLFVDLSGFTPFTNTLLQHRRDGAEVLSDTLARLFRPMIGAVYAAGGFISHFAGDAFLALFPDHEQDAAEAAWDTALAIERILSDTEWGWRWMNKETWPTLESVTSKLCRYSIGQAIWRARIRPSPIWDGRLLCRRKSIGRWPIMSRRWLFVARPGNG